MPTFEATMDVEAVNFLLSIIKDQPLKFVIDTKKKEMEVRIGTGDGAFLRGVLSLTDNSPAVTAITDPPPAA